MNKYDIALKTIKEAIQNLDNEELAMLLDQLDYILQTRCNNEQKHNISKEMEQ